jgi:hypothetical protein
MGDGRERNEPPSILEGVKKSGFWEMKKAAHVQRPEKFACQNEVVGSSRVGERIHHRWE